MGKSNTMHGKHRQIVRFQKEPLPKLEQSNKSFPKKKIDNCLSSITYTPVSQNDDKNC